MKNTEFTEFEGETKELFYNGGQYIHYGGTYKMQRLPDLTPEANASLLSEVCH